MSTLVLLSYLNLNQNKTIFITPYDSFYFLIVNYLKTNKSFKAGVQ